MTPESVDINSVVEKLVADRVASRTWEKDASLWPAESTDAEPAAEIMGWLELPDGVEELLEKLMAVVTTLSSPGAASGAPTSADTLRQAQDGDDRITDLVVMGMGGSSMTPEVLRVVFGTQPGGMRLHVLDTVNPGTIGPVTESLPLATTLFAVSSKSGTTVEPLSLEKHFRKALSDTGEENVADHFIAITDAGNPLAERAQAGEFAHWLETPKDVGGRFSALTNFGMFPAAALGVDVGLVASSAVAMADRCRPDSPDNPGLELGAILGANANAGRDKVTLITSPGLERFGLWVEQLLAESTGKHGKGLIPVANEPLLAPDHYGSDRNFVYLRLDGADNSGTDAHTAAVEAVGHPVQTYTIGNLEQLGGQFFLWEFAVAVAGHIIGIFPFDQPDVNAAKDAARAILDSGELPSAESETDLETAIAHLIETPKPGDYVAIAAFMPESPEASSAFAKLRSRITRKTGMATTFGFGPRYLHSVGQLYKGGTHAIRFLGVVSHGSGDIIVPGESYTLGALTPAQAYGDFEVMRNTGRRIQTAALGNNSVAEIEEALRD